MSAVSARDPGAMTVTEFSAATGTTAGAIEDLCTFRDMILEGRTRANLVGPSFESDFWRRHALDSAQLFHVEQEAMTWADVGAGAGFPGVVLAILAKHRGRGEVHLIDSQAKRATFLREVCAALNLPAVVHHDRAENLRPKPDVDVVTARACAPLETLLRYTTGFFRRGATGLFLKGKGVDQELAEARRVWTMTCDILPSQSDPSGRIVRVLELASRG